ncbi:hypothetical protein A4A49_55829, partial [Nicotiana attenuata]
CRCGPLCELKISWSAANPGRRYFVCKIGKDNGGCKYFRWFEDEFPEQANRVIWGLLKRVKAFDQERDRAKKWKNTIMFVAVLVALIIWLF